jgi:O-antigen/teichoic acid export membrane protein
VGEGYSKILIKNTFWIYLSKIITQIFALIINVYVILKLDVNIYGEFNFVLQTVIIISMFSLGSVNSVFNRYIPEFVNNIDYQRIEQLIKAGFFISSCIFIVLFILIFSLEKQFVSFFNLNDFESIKVSFFILIITFFAKSLSDNTAKALLLHKQVAKITILSSLFKSILYILLLNILNIELIIYIEILVMLIIGLSELTIISLFLKKSSKEAYINKAITPFNWKRVRKYGLFSSLNEIGAGIVGKTSDYFIVGALSNTYLLGLYAFAYRHFEYAFKLLPIKDVLTIIRPIFIQKFSNTENGNREFSLYFNLLVKILLPIYAFPFFLAIVFGKQVIELFYKDEYLATYKLIIIMLSGNIITAIFYPTTLTMVLKEKMNLSLISKSIVFFSIFAGIWSMKQFGLIGVVSVTVMGDFLRNLFIYILLNRKFKLPYNFKNYWKYVLAFVIPSTIFFFFTKSVDSPILLIILFILFFVSYLIFILLLNPFVQEEISVLKHIGKQNKILKNLYRWFCFFTKFSREI